MRPRPSLPNAALFACALATSALAPSCGRILTEDDCRKVADSLQQAWKDEAKKAAPTDGPAADKAAGVVRSEEERLVSEWTAECKRDLVGHPVEPRELDCLLAARTLAHITQCAEP